MDGLELRVGEADLHEQRNGIVLVQETLEGPEREWNLVGRWRHERRLRQRAAAGTDPVLAATQLAWGESRASHAFQERAVDLADEAHGHGQLRQARESVVHGADVVHHLAHVGRRLAGREDLRFRGEKIL